MSYFIKDGKGILQTVFSFLLGQTILPAFVQVDQDGNPIPTAAPYQATPLGFQQITDLFGPTGLSPPPTATFAVLSAEIAAVRYRDDGEDPTATSGMPLIGTIQYSGALGAIAFIEQTPGAILNVLYYK